MLGAASVRVAPYSPLISFLRANYRSCRRGQVSRLVGACLAHAGSVLVVFCSNC